MKLVVYLSGVMFVLIVSFAEIAMAQIMDSQYANWAVFSAKHQNQKICYLVGEAKTESGDIKTRSYPYITITEFNKGEEEFSVSSGYVYKEGTVKLFIDKYNEFALVAKGKLAWPSSIEDDKKIITMMQKAKTIEVVGSNARGQTSSDIYSLVGFNKAFKRIKQKCK